MELLITALYASILALIFFIWSIRTIFGRVKTRTNLGDGGEDLMLRRIRIHANFAEYVPILLILLGLLEMSDLASVWLHIFGTTVVFGRLSHAYGLWSKDTPGIARQIGMACTFTPLIAAAGYLLYTSTILL